MTGSQTSVVRWGVLVRLQYSSRTGLVGVLLWQQRRRNYISAVRQWQQECINQQAARRSAGRWARVRELFRQLTWRRTSISKSYEALKKKKGREGKKREDTGPVWVVQLVDVLLWMGGQRMRETVRATVVAAKAGRDNSRDRSGSSSWDGQGDLAETEADGGGSNQHR